MLKRSRFHLRMELKLLLQRSQEWLYPLSFFILLTCLFPILFSPEPVFIIKFFPSTIWFAALLASLLAIENLFTTDLEEGYLAQVYLQQTSLLSYVLVKVIAKWLATQLPLIIATPIIASLLGIPLQITMALTLSLLIGTPILTLIGTFGVSLMIGLRQQGMLLGFLIFPLVIPVLIFGMACVQQAQLGLSVSGPMSFLAGLNLCTCALLPIAISATLRLGLEH